MEKNVGHIEETSYTFRPKLLAYLRKVVPGYIVGKFLYGCRYFIALTGLIEIRNYYICQKHIFIFPVENYQLLKASKTSTIFTFLRFSSFLLNLILFIFFFFCKFSIFLSFSFTHWHFIFSVHYFMAFKIN